MKTISKDALRNMLRRKEGWKIVPDGVKDFRGGNRENDELRPAG